MRVRVTKNANKFQLKPLCIAKYLYDFNILFQVWHHIPVGIPRAVDGDIDKDGYLLGPPHRCTFVILTLQDLESPYDCNRLFNLC